MPCRPQPRRIVERARTHPDHAIPRRTANPAAARRAHQTGIDPTTVCRSLERSRLNSAETKGSLGPNDPHREGAAGQALAIGAVAGVDQLRRLANLVAQLAALAAAGLRELHRFLSSPGPPTRAWRRRLFADLMDGVQHDHRDLALGLLLDSA